MHYIYPLIFSLIEIITPAIEPTSIRNDTIAKYANIGKKTANHVNGTPINLITANNIIKLNAAQNKYASAPVFLFFIILLHNFTQNSFFNRDDYIVNPFSRYPRCISRKSAKYIIYCLFIGNLRFFVFWLLVCYV